jgi:glycosyltransferase involved in cell wall biosynthesis
MPVKNPEVSVVMPVFNGEKYLKEAIDSVLTQSFPELELIIINDGSTDNSLQVISSYSDARIRVITNEVNHGIAYSRNLGLSMARGKYLAWTDCDDINIRTRFEEQVHFLKNNNTIAGCGTSLIRFAGKKNYIFKPYTDPNLVKATLLFRPAIPNATVMLRLDRIREGGIRYNENLPIAEDYDFILSCSFLFPLSNIRKILYKYRDSETSIMNRFSEHNEEHFQIHKTVYNKAFHNLGFEVDDSQLRLHYLVCSEKPFHEVGEYYECYNWLMRIKQANVKTPTYNGNALNIALSNEFYFISKKASKFGLKIVIFYINKSISRFQNIKVSKLIKLSIRCLLKYEH